MSFTSNQRPLVVTTGEPAGIGPEISLRAAAQSRAALILLGDETLLREKALGLKLALPANVRIEHLPLAAPVTPGRLDVRNAGYVLRLLDRAIEGCECGEFSAMVTAPVQKSVIAESGVAFTGHTEYLAAQTATKRVVMMLVGGGLRVALATTHLALAEVPRAITRELLMQVLRILNSDLQAKFGIAKPHIAVAGLNPHAGEGGHLGREEIDVIAPAIAAARAQGIAIEGPLPADTLFVPNQAKRFDAVLAMYHDQGLPVLKHASFGHGVNVTLGLPFVRASVDHGTALNIAALNQADASSMIAALELAADIAQCTV